ncbi:MAG: LicD family protein [Rhodobacteraceae bacterium]|nr:LicD family protein [Paracoccaceae bacterium]
MIQKPHENLEAPHHHGFYLTRVGRWFYTYLDIGSKRFVSVPEKNGLRFFVAMIFVYGGGANTTVELEQKSGPKKAFRRVFIKSKFPYLTLKPNPGTYKAFFMAMGMTRHNAMRTLVIKTESMNKEVSFPICNIVPVTADDLGSDLQEIQTELAEMIDGGALTDSRLGALEQSLLALETQKNHQDIQRALIQLYCLYGVNHSSAYKRLKKWTPIERQERGEDTIAALNKQLQKITAPLALGRHGFNPSFVNLDLDKVETELMGFMEQLQTFNVQPFLNSGTLLGYFRDGRPIPHDDDFDLGILLPGQTLDEIFNNWRDFRRALGEQFNVIDKGSFVAIKLSNGIQVDLFAAWAKDDYLYVHPYCWADVKLKSLAPLKTLSIRGRDFLIPADPDAILSVNYGPNWRVPDPFWRFDFAKCKKRFRGALKELKLADYPPSQPHLLRQQQDK